MQCRDGDMNTQIRALLNEATSGVDPDLSIQRIVTADEMEKFAESIIRECAKAAGDFEYARLHDSLVEDHVLEHFGVKE